LTTHQSSSEQSETSDSVELNEQSDSETKDDDESSPAPFPQSLGLSDADSPLFSSADFRRKLPVRLSMMVTSTIIRQLIDVEKDIAHHKYLLSRAAVTRHQTDKIHKRMKLVRWYKEVLRKELSCREL